MEGLEIFNLSPGTDARVMTLQIIGKPDSQLPRVSFPRAIF